MIRFFRQIRQRLLTENKFSKYLLYAVGEILLVVIGILIALQLDSWKNEERDREKERYYLNSIKTSIDLSQDELERVINDADLISSAADTLFLLLSYEKYALLQGDFLDSLLFTASDYSQISLNDGGIQEVLGTGSLDIIRDDQIRLILASWDERIHKIRKYEGETVTLGLDYSEYLREYINASRWVLDSSSIVIPEKRTKLLTDSQLRNYLNQIARVHNMMFERYSDERKLLDSLKTLIDKQLLK